MKYFIYIFMGMIVVDCATSMCNYYWIRSPAAKTCILESYFYDDNGECKMTVECPSIHGRKMRHRFNIPEDDAANLVDCNGQINVNNCNGNLVRESENPTTEKRPPNPPTSTCEDYWKISPAAKYCQLVFYPSLLRNGKCQITAKCPNGYGMHVQSTVTTRAPQNVVNCGGNLANGKCTKTPGSSNPEGEEIYSPGTCNYYWNQSPVASNCQLDTSYSYEQGREICAFKAWCRNENNVYVQTSYSNIHVNYVNQLINCNGKLAFNVCTT